MTLISRVQRWWRRWRCFFRPVPEWEDRAIQARHRDLVWPPPVPGKPPLFGFPVEWIIAERDAATPSGLRYPDHATCEECREEIPARDGVRCLRCGVPMHPRCAGMRHSLSPPACPRCRLWVPIHYLGR